MKNTLIRLTFLAAAIAIVAPFSARTATAEATPFGIGSKAPALDIEHYIQDGDGKFKHVEKFEPGKVYVVEFWATWCGPCVMSMPHLAKLQQQYRGEGVQIISVSDEEVDEIQEFLKRDSSEEGKTFAEVTSAYTLTTDPDGSVYKDYMDAAKQGGIPTAFIVGKKGEIEWIGHPMEMDEPLEEVVNDKWDREAFKKKHAEQQQMEQAFENIDRLAGAGKFDEAIALIDKLMSTSDNEGLKENLSDFRFSLMLSAGKVTDDVVTYYEKQIDKMKDNPLALGEFGYSLVGVIEQGGKGGPIVGKTVKALASVADQSDAESKPILYNILAQLSRIDKQLDAAIEFQKKTVELAEGKQKERMQTYLDDLVAEKEKG